MDDYHQECEDYFCRLHAVCIQTSLKINIICHYSLFELSYVPVLSTCTQELLAKLHDVSCTDITDMPVTRSAPESVWNAAGRWCWSQFAVVMVFSSR